MAKLYFFYSSMNAGKTTSLLQCNYNYRQLFYDTLLLIPYVSSDVGLIRSRMGIFAKGIVISDNFNIFNYIKFSKKKFKVILVDEAQFLKKKSIFELLSVVDQLKISVFTYGLRTDFKAKLFEGSKYLLSFADEIIEIKTLCVKCSKKAIMNIRMFSGKKIVRGNQINTDKSIYFPVCRYHYYNFN